MNITNQIKIVGKMCLDWVLSDGEGYVEGAAMVKLAFKPDATPVLLYQRAGDVQSQTGAAGLGHTRASGPKEAGE